MTDEQAAIVESDEYVTKGEACAGSGKTYTAVKYVEKNHRDKILYVCFQKAMKKEAVEKFQLLPNCHPKTIHGLGWQFGKKYLETGKLSEKELTAVEVRNLLSYNTESGIEISENILKMIKGYLQSSEKNVEDTKIWEKIDDDISDSLFKKNVLLGTRILLKRMEDLSNPMLVSHDFYLKMFQLHGEAVPYYKRLIIDEAQDITERDLDIFKKKFFHMEKKMLFIGDSNQQIFGWRGAVNSLKLIKGKRLTLSTTFRNGEDIAELATYMLNKYKFAKTNIIGTNKNSYITSAIDTSKPYTIISRTNKNIIKNAFKLCEEKKYINFIGGIEKYGFHFIEDMYNFKISGKTNNPYLANYREYGEIKAHMEISNEINSAIKTAVEVVETYNSEIRSLMKNLKQFTTDKKDITQVFLTNVHQAKGLEFDNLKIDNDFIEFQNFFKYKAIANKNEDEEQLAQLEEEINSAYVALSRAKGPIELDMNFRLLQEKMLEENYLNGIIDNQF